MSALQEALAFVAKNFMAPFVFFLVFQNFGSKPAIACAVGATVVLLIYYALKRMRPSIFFIAASFFTVVFGGIDLLISDPRYFRLEPFSQNALVGSFFLWAYLSHKPVFRWLIEALPERFREPFAAGTDAPYLQSLTLVWAIYLYIKAGAFLWLAFQVNLGDLVLYRTVVGGLSGALLIGCEILYRTQIRGISRSSH